MRIFLFSTLLGLCAAISVLPAVAAPTTYETTVDAAFDAEGCSLAEAIRSINAQTEVGGCVLKLTVDDIVNLILVPNSIVTEVNTPFNSHNAFEPLTGTEPLIIRGVGGRATIRRGGLATGRFRFIESTLPSLTLENLVFEGGRLQQNGVNETSGGAVRVGGGDLIIHNARFADNQALGSADNGFAVGGAVHLLGGNLSITKSEFVNNRAEIEGTDSSRLRGMFGGAVSIRGFQDEVIVTDTLFRDNSTQADSNLMRQCQGGALIVSSDLEVGQSATERPQLVILRSAFINNSCYDSNGGTNDVGGAIELERNLKASILDSTFSNNSGGQGSALHARGVQFDIDIVNTTITNNLGSGAAVRVFTARPDSSYSTSKVSITNSILVGNLSDGRLANQARNLAIDIDADATSIIKNSALGSSEVAVSGSHVLRQNGSSVNLSGNNNLVLTSDGLPTPVGEILGSLRNGDSSKAHHPLVASSPAIDQGADFARQETRVTVIGPFTFYQPGCRGITNVSLLSAAQPPDFRVDQLGTQRPQGNACDIGPVEYQEDFCFPIVASQSRVSVICL